MIDGIEQYVLPVENVPRATPDETIGAMLELTQSSHEPVFVYDDKNKFQGIISPYHALFKRRLPPSTTIGSVVVVPPYLNLTDPLESAASGMADLRIYTLPVFKELNKIGGIVSAKNIFNSLLEDKKLIAEIGKRLTIHPPITAINNLKVADVYSQMRKKGVSRIIIVKDTGKLIGLLTRRDLQAAFVRPAPRQRFSKNSGDTGQLMFDAEEIYRRDDPIEKYYVTDVVTSQADQPATEAIKTMIKTGKSSIVLVDASLNPTGFFSIRDLLLSLATFSTAQQTPINIELDRPVAKQVFIQIQDLINKANTQFAKRVNIEKLEIVASESLSSADKPILFETIVSANLTSGKTLSINSSGPNLISAIESGIKKIINKQNRLTKKQKKGKLN